MPISPKLVPAKPMQSEIGICAFHLGPKLAAKQTKICHCKLLQHKTMGSKIKNPPQKPFVLVTCTDGDFSSHCFSLYRQRRPAVLSSL